MVKNPLNFIKKANSAFNLYLEDYDDLDSFIENSLSNQNTIIKLLESNVNSINENNKKLFDLYNNLKSIESSLNHLNDMMNDFEKTGGHIINQNNNILDLIDTSKNDNNYNFHNIIDLINNSKDQLVLSLDKNQIDIESLIYLFKNQNIDHINNVVGGLDTSLRGHVEDVVGEVNSFSGSFDDFKGDVNKFFNTQSDVNRDLVNAVKLFNLHYDECKKYFFNDNEKLLKDYLDTDELFRLCFFNNIKFLSYSPFENKILLQTSEGISLATNNRFYTIKEVIGFNGYSIPHLYEFDEFVVFDIGMNRGYASLWFAKFSNCSAVYGFEIDEDTYNKAVYNFGLNDEISSKISHFNYGLSDTNEIVDLFYLTGQDGLSTMIREFTNIQTDFKNNKDKILVKKVEVRNTTEVISNILKINNIKSKIVLKVDTEGAEFKIINDLIESGLINNIDLILGEGHKFTNEIIVDKLINCGFEIIKFDQHPNTYGFICLKKEYCDVWSLKEF